MTNKFKILAQALALGPLAMILGCAAGGEESGKPGAGGSSAGGARGGSGGAAGSGSGTGGASQPGTGGSGGGSGMSSSGGSGPASGAGGSPAGSGGATGGGGAPGGSDAGSSEAPPAVGGVEAVGKMAKSLFKIVIANYDGDGRSGCSNNDPLLRSQRNEDTLKGDASTTYDVTFRVKGLTEPKVYNGGTPDPANPFVLVGGTPSTSGRENASNQYMRLSVDVSEPKQVYWLNRFHGTHTDHEVYEMDYKLTVKVKGGATLALVLADGNSCAIANHRRKVVPGVPADVIMQPFKDQFLFVEVESVKPAM